MWLLLSLACTPVPTDEQKPAGDTGEEDEDTGEGDDDTGETDETGGTDETGDTADTDETGDTDLPAQGPDLVAVRIACDPTNPHLGDEVVYTITARNDGTEDAPSVSAGIYYSDNPRVTTSDPFVCAFTLDALAAGEERDVDVTCVVPTLVQGTTTAGVLLDDDELLAELDEDNNHVLGDAGTEVEVGDWPDLVIGWFYAEDYALAAYDRTEVHWQVDNLGTERTTGDWDVAFYLSLDGLFSADDLLLREETCTSILTEGDYTRGSGDWIITAPSPATTTSYSLLMVVDHHGLVDEQDESNNTLAAPELMVVTAEPTYDVAVLSVATAEYTVVEADTISYSIDLANNGNTDTRSFSLSLVYSTDTTIASDDARICTVTASAAIPPLGTTTLTGTCAAPGSLDGSYTFGVIADSTSAMTETDETNNTGYDATAVAVTPAHWDLVPSNAGAADTTVDWGDSVAFTYDVTNSGTTDLSGFEVGLYYSTNTAIATTDDLICTDTVTATLAAGATASYTATCDVPALSAGTYYFGVVVDPGGDVREDDETNNTAYDAAPVDHDGIDWNLEAYFVYESGWALTSGDSEDYDFEVRNLGTDDIADFTIELYYSRDATITTSDTLICSFPGESIDGLQQVAWSATCTVPSVSLYAEYYLGMIVDPDREVDETDETDNTTYSGSTVEIMP